MIYKLIPTHHRPILKSGVKIILSLMSKSLKKFFFIKNNCTNEDMNMIVFEHVNVFASLVISCTSLLVTVVVVVVPMMAVLSD